jgi:hypothetical protein
MKASDAAYEVLAAAGELPHVKELTRRVIAQGLWQTQGKTPSSTLGAILGTEINQLGAASRFTRRMANTFDLRRPGDPVPQLSSQTAGPGVWMFLGNPSRYNLISGIESGSVTNYAMNQHRDQAAFGDRVYFFLSGTKAGIYALGRITSTAYRAEEANEFGAWKVDVAFEATIEPPLLRAPDMTGDPVLASFGPFLGRMGTNFPIPSDVSARLDGVLAPRLRPVDASGRPSRFDPVAYELDRALERARENVKAEFLAYLRGLTATEFEHVVRLLLAALEYQDVKVVGKAGDHGIDVRAVLRYRGVANVPTFVQAKRFAAGNNVEGAVIGRLRGSLPVEAHGIVITTSDFTK